MTFKVTDSQYGRLS